MGLHNNFSPLHNNWMSKAQKLMALTMSALVALLLISELLIYYPLIPASLA